MNEAVAASSVQRFMMPPLRGAAILIGFSVPISVALDNILLALLLIGLLFNLRAVCMIAIKHPVARAGWLLFGMLFFAMFYGSASLREAVGILGKYADLAFIPLFILILSDDRARRRAQYAFLTAMCLTLLLSYLVWLGILPVQHWMTKFSKVNNPVIFYSHITQNNMMAFAVFLAALNCYKAVTATARIGWGVFALLASFNILFMVLGRTGYAILIVLLTWLAWVLPVRYMRLRGKRWGWRQVLATVFGFLFFIAVIFSVSSRLQNRVELVVSESQAWQTRQARSTSTGDRLDFYYNTLKIVQQHPVFGVGVGGFSAAFAHQVEGKDVLKTSNPHNEYLMISAQTGLVGLIFLLHLFYTQWRYAPLLTATFEQDAARGLVLAYMVNCAFNSALLDHSDGLFFAFMTAVLFAGLKPEKKDA